MPDDDRIDEETEQKPEGAPEDEAADVAGGTAAAVPDPGDEESPAAEEINTGSGPQPGDA